jgi:hypothetical protein
VQLASILREVCRHAQPAAGGLSAADKLLEIKRRSGRSTKGARLQVKGEQQMHCTAAVAADAAV